MDISQLRALDPAMAEKITVDDNGCWLWDGWQRPTDHGTYGAIGRNGQQLSTHRYAWELLVGPIPPGMVVDHVCRNTLCCNPDPAHLEPVTQAENIARGNHAEAQRARRAAQETCDSGRHPKTTLGRCAECNREKCKRYRDRRKAACPPPSA